MIQFDSLLINLMLILLNFGELRIVEQSNNLANNLSTFPFEDVFNES
jgi:hypothetical protein